MEEPKSEKSGDGDDDDDEEDKGPIGQYIRNKDPLTDNPKLQAYKEIHKVYKNQMKQMKFTSEENDEDMNNPQGKPEIDEDEVNDEDDELFKKSSKKGRENERQLGVGYKKTGFFIGERGLVRRRNINMIYVSINTLFNLKKLQ